MKQEEEEGLRVQYVDYAAWQRGWMRGEVMEEEVGYWKKQLEGMKPLELPKDYAHEVAPSRRAGTLSFEITEALTKKLRNLCHREDVTFFMILMAAFQLVIGTYADKDDVAVGTDIANRNRDEIENLIGFFVNQLVVRTDLSGNPSFTELLLRVRHFMLEAYKHQDAPFEKVVQELMPGRSLDSSPLFSVKLVLQNTPKEAMHLSSLKIIPIDIEPTVAKFDLMLTITEEAGGLKGILEYRSDSFSKATISLLQLQLTQVLADVVYQPDIPLSLLKEKLRATQAAYRRVAQQELKRATAHKLLSTRRKETPLF